MSNLTPKPPMVDTIQQHLVPTFDGNINGEHQLLVNARELHAFLESKQDFSTWVKSRIFDYGFQENQDFVRLHKKMEANNATLIEYHITLDMAKELSMVERNEKGKQARRYFIAMEKQAHSQHALLDKVDNDTAWLIDELQDEVLRTQPELLKLIGYYSKDLSQKEMALLLGVSDTTIRHRLSKLARLGFIDYTPNEKYQQMGRLGYQAKQLTLGV